MQPHLVLAKTGETPLGSDFRPGQYDVICERGKDSYNHNHHFREIIQEHLELYSQCQTKVDKSVLVLALVDVVRERSQGGGFIKFCHRRSCYIEIGDRGARQKVAHALRKHTLDDESDEKPHKFSERKKSSRKPSKGSKNSQLSGTSPTSLLDMFATEIAGSSTRTASCSNILSSPMDFRSIELDGSVSQSHHQTSPKPAPVAEKVPSDDVSPDLPTLSDNLLLESECSLLGLCEATYTTADTLNDLDYFFGEELA